MDNKAKLNHLVSPKIHPISPVAGARRYDVDSLRVLAFFFLILYHIAMYYVADWGWHIKSPVQSTQLQDVMLLLNPWRMPLIFMISGLVLALVEHKYSSLRLFKARFVRVLIPLVIGMYLIVPPQVYFELNEKTGFAGNYWEFLTFYVNPNTSRFAELHPTSLGLLTWNHLWYLAYLWHYTLLYILLRPVLTRLPWHRLVTPLNVALIPIFLLTLCRLTLKERFPITHALFNDWHAHGQYLLVFFLGYALAKSPNSWRAIIQWRRVWLGIALVHYGLLLLLFRQVWNLGPLAGSQFEHVLIQWILSTNVVAWLFCVLGYAGAYLNRPSRLLEYMNQAILPWYILHQTVIILLAVGLSCLALAALWEALLILVLTLALCAGGYEIIRRFKLLRWIFGL